MFSKSSGAIDALAQMRCGANNTFFLRTRITPNLRLRLCFEPKEPPPVPEIKKGKR